MFGESFHLIQSAGRGKVSASYHNLGAFLLKRIPIFVFHQEERTAETILIASCSVILEILTCEIKNTVTAACAGDIVEAIHSSDSLQEGHACGICIKNSYRQVSQFSIIGEIHKVDGSRVIQNCLNGCGQDDNGMHCARLASEKKQRCQAQDRKKSISDM